MPAFENINLNAIGSITGGSPVRWRSNDLNGNGINDHEEGQSSTITASLVANRSSGPAPLAVFFDSTGTTHINTGIDTFRQVGYYFDFDDPSSGTWTHSGLSKNIEQGSPLAAHVFETPGTYLVGVRARDASGSYSDAWVTITVTDPDIVYSGTNTVCVSRTSDTTGSPVGAQLVTNITSWSQLPSGGFESNKRYLLRAGQDFSSLGNLNLDEISDVQVGSFGVGAKPITARISMWVSKNNVATPTERVAVYDLNPFEFVQTNVGHNFLILNCTFDAAGSGIAFSSGTESSAINDRGTSQPEDWVWPSGIFVVDSYFDMQDVIGPDFRKNPIEGNGKFIATLGNEIYNSYEHDTRLYLAYKSLVAHSRLHATGASVGRHALKVPSIGPAEYDDLILLGTARRAPRTQYLKVSNNRIGDPTSPNDWYVQIAPENADSGFNYVQFHDDCIVENNIFVGGLNTSLDLQTIGVRITERGNTAYAGVGFVTYPSAYSAANPAYFTEDRHGPYYSTTAIATEAPVRG